MFAELKHEVEENLGLSETLPKGLQNESIRPREIDARRKLRSVESRADGYIIFLMGYAQSSIRDFESYFRLVVGLDEDDV